MSDDTLHLPLIHSVLEREKDTPGALLPILHAIQDGCGYIPDTAIPEIAHALNLSLAEVRGVISFYHDFRTTPPARHTLRLCRAESCQSRGPNTWLRNCANNCCWTTMAPRPTAVSTCDRSIAWGPAPVRQPWSWTASCTPGSPPSACASW
ncbi:Thioredoxin-like [2Fe-2S] ferredoxin [Pseudomonas chlororaphis]|nr:Thioredoxin-like [2Fe-2S] ferredoxin [Pseudomonas chlororaphis]